MYTKSKTLFFLTLIVLLIACNKPKPKERIKKVVEKILHKKKTKPTVVDTVTLKEAYEYVNRNNFNTDFIILVNLKEHSGNCHFFGMNVLKNDTILKGLVTHGHCQKYEGRFAEFSNCSSLGKCRIGGKYNGAFGTV